MRQTYLEFSPAHKVMNDDDSGSGRGVGSTLTVRYTDCLYSL